MPETAIQAVEEADDTTDIAPEDEGGEQEGQDAQSSPEAVRIAALMGWKDPAKWQGDPPPGGLKTAEEFLAEQPQVARALRQKVEKQQGQITRIIAQVAKLDRTEGRRRDADQEAALEAAMEAGDLEGAKKILADVKAASTVPDEPPALTAFKERNEWFGVDDEATAYAEALDKRFAAAGPITDPDAHMRKVEAGVKKAFPELFGESKPKDGEESTERRKAPLVARGARTDRARDANGPITVADLTPTQRKACVTMGVSEKDYVKYFNDLNKAS